MPFLVHLFDPVTADFFDPKKRYRAGIFPFSFFPPRFVLLVPPAWLGPSLSSWGPMRSSLQTSLPFSLQVFFFCLSPQARVLLNDRSPHLEKEKVQKQQWKRTQGATENTHDPRASKSFLFVVPSWQIPQFQQFASMPFFSFSGQHIQKCKIGLPNPKCNACFQTFSKKQKKDVFSNGNGILRIAGGARNGRGLRLGSGSPERKE